MEAPSFSLGLDFDSDSEKEVPVAPNSISGMEAPSFSLGIDFDLDSEKEVFVAPNSVSAMEAPSFSLGLDFDLDSEEALLVAPDSPLGESSSILKNDQQLRDSVPEPSAPTEPPAPIFRRLRRGPSTKNTGLMPNRDSEQSFDDDIEEFSSDELPPKAAVEHQTAQPRSICSSSKLSLHGHMTRTTHPTSTTRKQQLPDTSTTSASTKTNKRSKSTMSPLRHFQLLESDSDDDSFEELMTDKTKHTATTKVHSTTRADQPRHNKRTAFVSPLKDLWDGFQPKEMTTTSIPTPALDSFCDEYFKCVKEKQTTTTRTTPSSVGRGSSSSCVTRSDMTINGIRNCQLIDLENGVPPCHLYFFHSDPRIQRLVRNRLPHFQPLGIVNNTGNHHQLDASVIDYMSQFGEGGSARKSGARSISLGSKGSRSRKNNKSSRSVGAGSSTSGDWVNPRNLSAALAKEGRGHGQSQSAGHWFTGEDGRKVYINKKGQEVTGQSAYRQYKRECGGGFRKSKGKSSSKRRKK